MQNHDLRLVMIRWVDSRQPVPTWQYVSDLQERASLQCTTVGWLLRGGDDKVICQTLGDPADPECMQASGVMTIPARCVVEMISLSEITSSLTCQDAGSSLMPQAT